MVEGSVHMAATSLNLQKVAICKHVHIREVFTIKKQYLRNYILQYYGFDFFIHKFSLGEDKTLLFKNCRFLVYISYFPPKKYYN